MKICDLELKTCFYSNYFNIEFSTFVHDKCWKYLKLWEIFFVKSLFFNIENINLAVEQNWKLFFFFIQPILNTYEKADKLKHLTANIKAISYLHNLQIDKID